MKLLLIYLNFIHSNNLYLVCTFFDLAKGASFILFVEVVHKIQRLQGRRGHAFQDCRNIIVLPAQRKVLPCSIRCCQLWASKLQQLAVKSIFQQKLFIYTYSNRLELPTPTQKACKLLTSAVFPENSVGLLKLGYYTTMPCQCSAPKVKWLKACSKQRFKHFLLAEAFWNQSKHIPEPPTTSYPKHTTRHTHTHTYTPTYANYSMHQPKTPNTPGKS